MTKSLDANPSVSASAPSPRPGTGVPQSIAKPIRRKVRALRLHGTVARDLGIRIVTGALPPGSMLEGEIAASEQFRVSRTAYREAIRILAAKGLVHSRPKIGTQVSERTAWHLLDPDVLGWMFANEDPDPKLIESLFELRRIVEPDAARLAAMRRTPEQLERMRAGLAGVEHHSFATEEGRSCDHDFHAALLEASHNDFVISLTNGVATAIELTTAFKQDRLPAPHDALPVHLRVFEAIEAQDEQEAHDAMAALVDRGLSDTMEAREGSQSIPRPGCC